MLIFAFQYVKLFVVKFENDFVRLFGHSILFSTEPEEANHFRSILLPLFTPDGISCKNHQKDGRGEEIGCWYSAITKDVCDSWLSAEIDPYVKKSAHGNHITSEGKPIVLYEAFKRLASQWVSFKLKTSMELKRT